MGSNNLVYHYLVKVMIYNSIMMICEKDENHCCSEMNREVVCYLKRGNNHNEN
jgi:hypothetical protein